MTEIVKPATLDILDTNKPSLSTGSDMPVVETLPDASNQGKPPAQPATEAPAAPSESDDKTPSESATEHTEDVPGEPEKAKPPRGVQKRLDELTKQREDERRRAEAAEARLDRALAALESRTGQPAKETKEEIEQEDPEPVRPSKSEFTGPEAYDNALDAYYDTKGKWVARREVKALMAENERKAAERQAQESARTVRESYGKRTEKAKEKYPDYSQVAESPDVSISVPMAHVIMTSEQGPDIAYFLGKNPAEAQRISSMTVNVNGTVIPDVPRQMMELGLIAARLSTPTPPASKSSLTQAPKPISPLGSGSESVAKSEEEESMDEYATRRKKELSERRPGMRH